MFYDTGLEFHGAKQVGFTVGGGQALAFLSPILDPTSPGIMSIDLVHARDVAEGHHGYVRFVVTTTFTIGAGTPGLVPVVLMADTTDMNTNQICVAANGGGPVAAVGGTGYGLSGFTATGLTAGTEILIPLPPPQAHKKFLSVGYIQPAYATAYFSAGSMRAHVAYEPRQLTKYTAVNRV